MSDQQSSYFDAVESPDLLAPDHEFRDFVWGVDYAIQYSQACDPISKDVRFRIVDEAHFSCANVVEEPKLIRISFSRSHLSALLDIVRRLMAETVINDFLRFDEASDGSLQDRDNLPAVLEWGIQHFVTARRFSMAAAMYATFHELAHVLNGHTRFLAVRYARGEAVPALTRQTLEYDADCLAVRMLLTVTFESYRKQDRLFDMQLLDHQHAIRIALFCIYCSMHTNRFPYDLSGNALKSNHPSMSLRIGFITGLIGGIVGDFGDKGLMPSVDMDVLLSQFFRVMEEFFVREMSPTERFLLYENLDDIRDGEHRHYPLLHARWAMIYEELTALKMSSRDLSRPVVPPG
ncbi:MAG TPA: hypothetical protein VMH86_02230 [Rhizomicrobium sp.]|nr:hypothetical protein [Rhizomicrobium sp.]